jgi:hypothetical protein
MLLNLGEVSLDEVSLEYPSVRGLSDYKPPTVEPEIRKEQMRFGMGAEIDGFVFKRNVPLKQDSTYVLRSISYSTSDTLVVLRVVRKDSDGSVIIAWKLLKNFPVPKAAQHKVNEDTQSVVR